MKAKFIYLAFEELQMHFMRMCLNFLLLTCELSILGGFLIIVGLYFVTWALFRERHATLGIIPHVTRTEPLIQRGHIFLGTPNLLSKSLD